MRFWLHYKKKTPNYQEKKIKKFKKFQNSKLVPVKPIKEMSAKKPTPFSVLGLLFGDTLEELICPFTVTLAIGFIGFKLMTYLITEIGFTIDAIKVLIEKLIQLCQFVYNQYLAYTGYKIVPLNDQGTPAPKVENLASSRTDIELKPTPVKKPTEERIIIERLQK